jgi:hypothetical protein
LGFAVFGVEIVEHWDSPSFMLRLQLFSEESKEIRSPYIQNFSSFAICVRLGSCFILIRNEMSKQRLPG